MVGLKTLFTVVSTLGKVAAVAKVTQEINKYVSPEMKKTAKKNFSAAVEKVQDLTIKGLEKVAPDMVKEIVERNAPEAMTADTLTAAVVKALAEAGTTAPKTGTKATKTVKAAKK